VINRLKAGHLPAIYGTSFPTPDGTCIRGHLDVRNIAGAHVAPAESSAVLSLATNVRTSRGGSAREIIKLVSELAVATMYWLPSKTLLLNHH
jgi:UDP-glucose 4-epimerase